MNEERIEYEHMLAGEPAYSPDSYMNRLRNEGRARLAAFNATPITDVPARIAAMKELFQRPVRMWIESPFFVEYGIHTTFGDYCFVNANCTFLDTNRITVGSQTLIGPNVQLITSGHPIHADERWVPYPEDERFPGRGLVVAKPIEIGARCWIGAGAIVLPGVTIGAGTTVGAGSVVTRSVPERVVVAGNPARVIRELGPFDESKSVRPNRPHNRASWPDFPPLE